MPAVDFDNVTVGNSHCIKELLFVLIQQAFDRERIISGIIQNKMLILWIRGSDYPCAEHNVMGKDRIHLMQKVTDYFEDYLK